MLLILPSCESKLVPSCNLPLFTSVIALYFKPLEKNYFFEGTVYGKISKRIRGSGGFGFDPIFLPDDMPTRTFAELTTGQKNKISEEMMFSY